MKVIIEVNGGVVKEVFSDDEDIEIVVVDHNEDGDETYGMDPNTDGFEEAQDEAARISVSYDSDDVVDVSQLVETPTP